MQIRGESLHVFDATCLCQSWSPDKRLLSLRLEIEAENEDYGEPLSCELSMSCLARDDDEVDDPSP